MIPFLSALMGAVTVRCPSCGKTQATGRKQSSVRCRECGRSFPRKEARDLLERSPDRKARRK